MKNFPVGKALIIIFPLLYLSFELCIQLKYVLKKTHKAPKQFFSVYSLSTRIGIEI